MNQRAFQKQARIRMQNLENKTCLHEYKKAMSEFEECYRDNLITWRPLYHCQASYFKATNYIFLKSYNTIVCIIKTYDLTLYDVLRYVYGYTNTSAQHIRKFSRFFGTVDDYTYRHIEE